MKFRVCITLCLLISLRSASGSEDADGLQFFEQHIRPLLIAKCVKCHGPQQQKSGLRLDSKDAAFAGGDSGHAIEPHDAESSLLVSAVRYDSLEMPPNGKLSDKEIAAIEKWVELGAPWPDGAIVSAEGGSARSITDEDRSHWSFRPIADSAVPEITEQTSRTWTRNPIDNFVLSKLQQQRLSPAPTAKSHTLVRRVYFDLLGLAPTPKEVQRFVKDKSPDAYEKLVDDLLARPAYGERWARHWLDLVRYAESDGFRQDAYRPGSWRYRDYVIRSLNEDKPYDQFLTEQLAGDELYPNDPSAWVGTSYFRLQPYEYNQRDIVTQRQDILNDITDVTADVFLGLGMKCARCHDHKFDPILQTDYFRLQAHFAALLPHDNKPLANTSELAKYQQKLANWEDATKDIRAQIAAIKKPYLKKQADAAFAKFTPELQAMFLKAPAERGPLEKQLAYFIARQTREEGKRTLSKEDAQKVSELEADLRGFAQLKPAELPTIPAIQDVGSKAPPTFVSAKRMSPDEPIQPNGIEVLSHLIPEVEPSASHSSTGRRTALAKWLTSENHPLTARVAVNRIWQHHFGRGLVATPSDFGRLGAEPSHPALLDWLAIQFMKSGWQTKTIHRMILTSATYRQSARHPHAERQETIDPANAFCWRARVRRLDAEQLIDTSLQVSGRLRNQLGGPSESSNTERRAVYRKVLRNKPDRLLGLFDGADSFNSTAERSVTTTSPQALALLNGEFGNVCAESMANRLATEPDARRQVQLAYELAFARAPTTEELQLAIGYVGSSPTLQQLTDLCHVLLNANEFIYVD